MVLAYDIRMLKQRAAEAREAIDDAQSDADFAACVALLQRAMADRAALSRHCPLKTCRRARRCAGVEQPCLSMLAEPVLPFERQREIIDDLYYDMQARRLAEEAE